MYDAVLLSMGLHRSLQQHVLVTGLPNRHKNLQNILFNFGSARNQNSQHLDGAQHNIFFQIMI